MRIGPFVLERKQKPANAASTDLRHHPNAQPLSKAERDKILGLVVDLVRQARSLTRDDNASWRLAWQMALNLENPKRIALLDHYRNSVIDLHLTGCIIQRKLAVMMKTWKVVDEGSGDEDEEATKLLRKRWFRQFMNLALDTPYYGHTLVQMGDIFRDEAVMRFNGVTMIPREHVVPEHNRVVKYMNDHWKTGVDYTKPPYSNWCISMGDQTDLGLLLKVTPSCISIRHIEAFWDQFAEIFGIPLRIGKTASRDPKDRSAIEDMLTQMGSAAWGLFPEGTEIEIKETTRTDSFKVFDERIVRAEKRISKAILGTTMTIDDGSSKSQADVHLAVNKRVIESDADWFMEVVNDDLVPLMIIHGFPLKGKRVVWDESKTYEPQELTNVLNVLLQYYKVDEEWLVNTLNIPLERKPDAAPTPPPNSPQQGVENILKSFFG